MATCCHTRGQPSQTTRTRVIEVRSQLTFSCWYDRDSITSRVKHHRRLFSHLNEKRNVHGFKTLVTIICRPGTTRLGCFDDGMIKQTDVAWPETKYITPAQQFRITTILELNHEWNIESHLHTSYFTINSDISSPAARMWQWIKAHPKMYLPPHCLLLSCMNSLGLQYMLMHVTI